MATCQKFGAAITVLTIFGHAVLGFEQSYAHPLVALATAYGVELLLVGTGNVLAINPALRSALKGRGIAVEFMDSGAACRTYNVLLGEERRVATALVAIA